MEKYFGHLLLHVKNSLARTHTVSPTKAAGTTKKKCVCGWGRRCISSVSFFVSLDTQYISPTNRYIPNSQRILTNEVIPSDRRIARSCAGINCCKLLPKKHRHDHHSLQKKETPPPSPSPSPSPSTSTFASICRSAHVLSLLATKLLLSQGNATRGDVFWGLLHLGGQMGEEPCE